MKPTRRSITRRGFGCILGGAFSAAAAPSGRLTWDHVGGEQQTLEFRYRADAQISVLSVPLLHRAGVGGGSVIWREAAEPGGSLVRFLEFNGFSLPAQAAGLNRLGFIREMSRLEGPHSTESIYFGLMTSSPEESADQARRTLHSTAKEQQYTAIDGRILPGSVETTTAHFAAASALSANDRVELMQRARQALASGSKVTTGPVAGGPPFLQALADMLRRPTQTTGSFVYSGHPYSLVTSRAPDVKATAYFKERQLIPANGSVTRVSGKVRRQAGGKETEFRLWIDANANRPLPLRIEYRAKPYLRLTFEVETAPRA